MYVFARRSAFAAQGNSSKTFAKAWAFTELKNLPEGKGGGVVIQAHPHEVLRVSVDNPFELADADTPETLTMLKGFYHD